MLKDFSGFFLSWKYSKGRVEGYLVETLQGDSVRQNMQKNKEKRRNSK